MNRTEEAEALSGHELAMTLRRAYLAMHRRTNAALDAAGVTADQFVVLMALDEEDALTQRELVQRTSSDANTLRAMLVLLERRGLIERQPHPTDRRARSVALTSGGRSTLHKLWRRSEPLREAMLDALTLDESVQLLNGLRRLTAAMHELRSPAKRKRPSVGAVS